MDRLSFFFSALQNAHRANKSMVRIPSSKTVIKLLTIFREEKYIDNFKLDGTNVNVSLKYDGDSPMFQQIKRISKPGRRVYCSAHEVSPAKFTILSTSKGIMAGRKAQSNNVGGELICEVLVAKTP